MSEMGNAPSLSQLMQVSTQAIYDCQKSLLLSDSEEAINVKGAGGVSSDQAKLLLNLMENLVDTKIQLTNEIESDRIELIDPTIINDMEAAIQMAIKDPLDAKVNQIYLSIFGYNSPLWQVLREMQKLLQTVEILKDPRGKRVAKVEKKNRERRKKHHEKDSISINEKDEEKK